MNKKAKVNASILIIGNEILSGRTQDTNTSTLAIWLNSIGVNVTEVRVIPDVEKTIIDTLRFYKIETFDEIRKYREIVPNPILSEYLLPDDEEYTAGTYRTTQNIVYVIIIKRKLKFPTKIK